jgi:hypothetical protein
MRHGLTVRQSGPCYFCPKKIACQRSGLPRCSLLVRISIARDTWATLRPVWFEAFSLPHLNPKYFLFHPSHQIFRRMYGALNVGKKDN